MPQQGLRDQLTILKYASVRSSLANGHNLMCRRLAISTLVTQIQDILHQSEAKKLLIHVYVCLIPESVRSNTNDRPILSCRSPNFLFLFLFFIFLIFLLGNIPVYHRNSCPTY